MQRERKSERSVRVSDAKRTKPTDGFVRSLSLSRLSSFFASKNEKRKGKREKERRRNFVGRDHTTHTHTRKRDFAKRAWWKEYINNKKTLTISSGDNTPN